MEKKKINKSPAVNVRYQYHIQVHHFYTFLGSHPGFVFGPVETNRPSKPHITFPYHRDAADGRSSVRVAYSHRIPRNAMASSPLAPTRTYSPLVPKLPRPSPPSPCSSPRRSARWPRSARARATPGSSSSSTAAATEEQKRCLRCGGVYRDEENHPTACAFHGHITGGVLSSQNHPLCSSLRWAAYKISSPTAIYLGFVLKSYNRPICRPTTKM